MFLKEKNKKVDIDDLHLDQNHERDITKQVIKEENVEESKATENREPTAGERKRTRTLAKNDILEKATVEDQPVTFASLPSEGEGEGDEQQMKEEQEEKKVDSRKKRLASKIDKLFYDALRRPQSTYCLGKWRKEESWGKSSRSI